MKQAQVPRHAAVLAALLVSGCQPLSCSPRSVASPRRTTDGTIALDNLRAQIEAQENLHARSPDAVEVTGGLINLLQMRAQFLGRLSDYDRALALAEEAVSRAPGNPAALLLRAGARSALHRFSEARADLDRAEALGGDRWPIASARASILQAQGAVSQAISLWRQAAAVHSDIHAIGSLAVAEAENGNAAEAERLFAQAEQSYRDVSPFPLAWLEFQRGKLAHSAGDLTTAQQRYRAARHYLPQDARATQHLAEVLAAMGEHRQAVELLRPLLKTSEDPEHAAQLALSLSQLGQLKEASGYRAQAAERYRRLLKLHPEAFADHAARFWIEDQPAQALVLARANLANRQTPEAFELAVTAAVNAGEHAAACDLAEQSLALPRRDARLRVAAARAFEGCGRSERAAQERATVFGTAAVR